MKFTFREILPFLTSRAPSLEMKDRVYANCVRCSMTYGSETSTLLADVGLKFERAEMQIIRWMCGVSLKDRRTSEELRKLVRVQPQPTRVQDLSAVNVTSQSQADRVNRNAYRYTVVTLVLSICK